MNDRVKDVTARYLTWGISEKLILRTKKSNKVIVRNLKIQEKIIIQVLNVETVTLRYQILL